MEGYLRRFVSYPSEHALVAHCLWIAHTHLIECFDTTPRLAFMSAEKELGKTRALEVTELFVPDPIFSFNAFRRPSSPGGRQLPAYRSL